MRISRPTRRHIRGIAVALALLAVGALTPTLVSAALYTDTAVTDAPVTSIQQYDTRVLAAGPVGYWRLSDSDRSNGAAATDATGHGNTGAYRPGVIQFTSTNAGFNGGPNDTGYQYVRLANTPRYTIQAGDRFEFEIKAIDGATRQGVDFVTTDNTTLRDAGLRDRDGNYIHPDLSNPPSDRFQLRIVDFPSGSSFVGKTIDQILLANEANSSATQSVFISQIRIVNSNTGQVRVTFWGRDGYTPPAAPAIASVYASSHAGATNTVAFAPIINGGGPLVQYNPGLPSAGMYGSQASVDLPGTNLDFANASAFTIEVWAWSAGHFRYDGSGIVCRQNASYAEQYCIDSYRDQVRFWVRRASDSAAIITTGPSINNSQWHHIVGVFDSGTVTLWVDGVAQTSASGATGGLVAVPASAPTRVGARPGNPYYSDATNGAQAFYSEVAIYNRALTPAEITDHWVNH